jgi:hypothetical protein
MRQVASSQDPMTALREFGRWPTWMWADTEVPGHIEQLLLLDPSSSPETLPARLQTVAAATGIGRFVLAVEAAGHPTEVVTLIGELGGCVLPVAVTVSVNGRRHTAGGAAIRPRSRLR